MHPIMNPPKAYILSLIFVGLMIPHQIGGEVYTALAEMEELLETEAYLISNLEAYIATQEQKLNFLKR